MTTAEKDKPAEANTAELHPFHIDNPPIGKPVHFKLAWIQNNAGHVEKTGEVKFGSTKYEHMQEHGLLQVLKPLLREALCSVVPEATLVEHAGNHMTLDYSLQFIDAESGESITKHFIGEGTDSTDKASYKGMTGGMKYALQKFFLIPTEKLDEPEGSSPANNTASTRTEAKVAQPPKKKKISNANAIKLADAAGAAIRDGKLTAQAVKAYLQTEFGADTTGDLSQEEATQFGDWLIEKATA